MIILALVARRIPLDAFRDAIEHGPHVQLGLVMLALTCGILCTDSLTVWVGLRALGLRRPKRDVLAIRGATYLLVIVNYALGQGAFGVYLNRTGLPGLRAVGATLFLVGTNLAMLMLGTLAVWSFGSSAPPHDALWWTLVLGCSGFAVYLVVIALAPRFLASNALLAPLFDAGVRGHLIALFGRLPHTVMIVVAPWIAIRVWGIPVPAAAGLTLMPIVAIATVLPISPAGLGTAQVALVYFFGHWATDTKVLAFSIVYFVYGLLASAIVGFVSMSLARRYGILATDAAGSEHTGELGLPASSGSARSGRAEASS